MREIKAKDIKNERINKFMENERWVDYQDIFKRRFDLDRQFGLEEALERTEIEAE